MAVKAPLNTTSPVKRGRGRPAGTSGTKQRQPQDSLAGTVSDGESLRIEAFCKRMGWSRPFVRGLAADGLPIRKVKKYRVIRGKDFNDFIGTCPCAVPTNDGAAEPNDSIEDAGPDGSPEGHGRPLT